MGGGNQAFGPSHKLSAYRRDTCQKDNSNPNLHGIVDMGSNGIRFSITDLTPTTARILPTLYSYRNGISLYEAQYDGDGNQIPIPEEVQSSVIGAFLRFEIYCSDFGVPFKNIRIIATEATRKALNGEEFVARVARETGLVVEVLSQAGEGETGAWGIASSASEVRGIVMDLGGGSTQITWIMTKNGHMETSPAGAFSFPYGAAALTQRLQLIEKKHDNEEDREAAREDLRAEMKENFLKAYNGLQLPSRLIEKAKKEDGFTLYLSGGGFRGWGYLLLYQAQKHRRSYPISIINGFVARKKDFTDTARLKKLAKQAQRIFRVSDRRREQVPAVAFLVNVLAETLPYGVKEAHFCQGGVREGVLFRSLPPEIRDQSPIEMSTAPYAKPLARKLARLLESSIPKRGHSSSNPLDMNDVDDGWDEIPSLDVMKKIPKSFTVHIIEAMANMIYLHSDLTKELSSVGALYTTSTGALADTHGTSHRNRALLALLLEARYTGDLPPKEYDFRAALRRLLTPNMQSCDGKSSDHGDGIATSGSFPDECTTVFKRPHHKKPHLDLHAEFADDLGKSGKKSGLRLTFHVRMREHIRDDPMKVRESLETHVQKIVKVGKKKNWVRSAMIEDEAKDGDESDGEFVDLQRDGDGDDEEPVQLGWGMKVDVQIVVEYPKAVATV